MAFTPAQSAYLADLLTGIGQGFMSAPRNGPPLAGFGMGLQNANQLMGQRRQQADQDQERQFRTLQMQRQQKLDAEADAAKAQQQAALSQLLPRTTNQAAMPPGGPGAGTAPPPTSLSGFTPEQIAILRTLPADQALSAITSQAFKDPKDPKAPPVSGGMQFDYSSGTWKPIPGYTEQAAAIAAAGRAPVQPPQLPADIQEWMLDRKNDPNNPAFKTIAGWRKAQQANNDATPKIITLHGPKGEIKSAYETDPSVPGMLQSGWTTEAPTTPKLADIVTLTKDGQTKTITRDDPQFGMYLGSGWIDANAAPKAAGIVTLYGPSGARKSVFANDPSLAGLMQQGWTDKEPTAKAGPVITGDDAAKFNLDPSRSWQQKPDGTFDEILPKTKATPDYMTLVSPDGSGVTTLEKSSPNVKALLDEGYVERSGADPNTKPFAEDERKTAQLLEEILPDYKIAVDNFDSLTHLGNQVAGKSPEFVQSYFTSPEYQRGVNAISHIIANNLYSLSGAAIQEAEAQRRARLLLPVPGESDGSIADKKARIAVLLGGMKTRAGRAGSNLNIPGVGGQASPPPVPADLPQGSTYYGKSPAGNPVYKLPNGTTVEETP